MGDVGGCGVGLAAIPWAVRVADGRLTNDAKVPLLFADHSWYAVRQKSIKSDVDARWIYGKNCVSFFTQSGYLTL